MVSVLEVLVRLRLNPPTDWIKSPHLKVERSMAFSWLRRLKNQIQACLPLLREKLLTLKPDAPVRTQPTSGGLMSAVELFQQFLNVAQSLHQTTISLLNESPEDANLFSFLNYFLAQNTGNAGRKTSSPKSPAGQTTAGAFAGIHSIFNGNLRIKLAVLGSL